MGYPASAKAPAKPAVVEKGPYLLSELEDLSFLFIALLSLIVEDDTDDGEGVTHHSCHGYWVPEYQN